ncbi:hypothetical protein ACLOJK_008126 [Asimina triloba]
MASPVCGGSAGAGSRQLDSREHRSWIAGDGSPQLDSGERRSWISTAVSPTEKKQRRRGEREGEEGEAEARDGREGGGARRRENGDREGGGDGGERRQGRRLRRRGNGDREGGRDGGERRQGRRRRRGRTETGKEADGGRTETGKEAETAGEWRQGMEAGDDGRREGGRWEMTVRKMGAGRRGEASREVSREARAGDREEGRRGQGDGAAAQALGHEWIRRLGQRMHRRTGWDRVDDDRGTVEEGNGPWRDAGTSGARMIICGFGLDYHAEIRRHWTSTLLLEFGETAVVRRSGDPQLDRGGGRSQSRADRSSDREGLSNGRHLRREPESRVKLVLGEREDDSGGFVFFTEHAGGYS